MFGNVFNNKKVFITGNTGFKGSWLTMWLLKLGADVVGYSKDIPTEPSAYNILELKKKINNHSADVCDFEALSSVINREKPDFIFHLAAQAIVSESYIDPTTTIRTNAVGTMNILETVRKIEWDCTVILITSDKSYKNIEQIWGYKETDKLGGDDVYSGSKGAAELIIQSYYESFFQNKIKNVRIGIARAGNVIGGADWAKNRIIVDCIKAWVENKKVEIRSPNSTRPWQHVLEPLSGYLCLAQKLCVDKTMSGESFNFGPKENQNRTVQELISDFSSFWDFKKSGDSFIINDQGNFKEANLLKLNCEKAKNYLGWEPTLNYSELVQFVSLWYKEYYKENLDIYNFSIDQIEKYQDLASKRKIIWAN